MQRKTYLKELWNIKENWEDYDKKQVHFESSFTEIIASKF